MKMKAKLVFSDSTSITSRIIHFCISNERALHRDGRGVTTVSIAVQIDSRNLPFGKLTGLHAKELQNGFPVSVEDQAKKRHSEMIKKYME